ncbi:MAG: hypothetical protein GX800_13045, partial [Clostridiaceae bacterium]|nr:hypothetical protein [Clostridiaceae bacterium]
MLIKLFKTNLVKATSIILVLVFMFSSIHPCIAQNPEDEAAYSGSLIQFEFNRAAAYPMDTTYEDTDNTWRFVANSSGWTPTDSKSYNTNPSNYDGMQLHFGDKNQRYWMVFELNIPYAGKYRVNMSHKANKNGASSYMFFFPETEDIESQLNEENRIGMVNYYSSEFQEKVDTELTDITVTSSGKYFIAIQYIASSSRLFMYPGVLTLDGTVLDNVCLLLEDDAIGPGETVTASMTAQLSSGEAVNLDSVEVLYSSSEPAIAAIDSDTGAITGISEGETEISVTVASDNISITESKTLRVAEDYSVKSIKLSYPDTMYVGNQYQLELSALLTNNELRSIPIQEAEVELISSEPENVVTINDNGLVSADNLGAAVISVKTTYRGKALESESVILRVTQLHSSEFSYLYNFWYQAYVGDISKNGREYTDYSKTRLWAYVEDTSTVSSSSGTAIDILTANMQIVLKKDEWFTFKINVPEEGKYNALFDYSAGKNRGIIDFYIAPLPEDISKETIESNINDKNKIASVDMYNSESIKASDELADINFEKPGEYLLILYSADKNASSSNYYMFPISLRFEGLNALKSIELSLDNSSNEIEIGNSTRLKYSGTLVDGTETALTDGNVKLVFTSFNPQIASVDKDGIIS